jgi:hypothetical protein
MTVLEKVLKRVDDAIPAPMAAPETSQLRTQRHRLIGASVVLAVLCLSAVLSSGPLSNVRALLIVGLLVFVVIEGAIWAKRKHAADDAYLDELCRRDLDEDDTREPGQGSIQSEGA